MAVRPVRLFPAPASEPRETGAKKPITAGRKVSPRRVQSAANPCHPSVGNPLATSVAPPAGVPSSQALGGAGAGPGGAEPA